MAEHPFFTPETQDFILQHRTDEVRMLALQASRYPLVDMQAAVQQIAGWQMARRKLPLWSDTPGLIYPPHLSMEQCSSQITALYKAEVMGEGHTLADLTGGFGVDCSYLAKGYKEVFYVEHSSELCQLAKHNFPLLCLPQITVIQTESEDFLQEMQPVDSIFLDPARRDSHGGRTVAISDCTPDVSALHNLLLRKARRVMVKLSPMLDISLALRDLPAVRQVHVVAVKNECKELLFVLEQDVQPLTYHCVNLGEEGSASAFVFTPEEEQGAACAHTAQVGGYLYEPNSALLKAGAFRCPAVRFNLKKLHPSSHLYTSDTVVKDFPGRSFCVKGVYGFGKKELKALSSALTRANLTVRNFPSSVADLRKRLKLAEGGNDYLFATTLNDGRKVLIWGEKV